MSRIIIGNELRRRRIDSPSHHKHNEDASKYDNLKERR